MKTEIVKVNGQDILCPSENGENFVAIKPICNALGIDPQKQFERIKNDRKLKDVYTVSVYAPDPTGRNQQMFCIPLKYIFGWLFSIDESKVNEENRDNFIRYKDECYEVLYNHFFASVKKQLEVNQLEISLLEEINALNETKTQVVSEIKDKKTILERIREERLRNEPTLF